MSQTGGAAVTFEVGFGNSEPDSLTKIVLCLKSSIGLGLGLGLPYPPDRRKHNQTEDNYCSVLFGKRS